MKTSKDNLVRQAPAPAPRVVELRLSLVLNPSTLRVAATHAVCGLLGCLASRTDLLAHAAHGLLPSHLGLAVPTSLECASPASSRTGLPPGAAGATWRGPHRRRSATTGSQRVGSETWTCQQPEPPPTPPYVRQTIPVGERRAARFWLPPLARVSCSHLVPVDPSATGCR